MNIFLNKRYSVNELLQLCMKLRIALLNDYHCVSIYSCPKRITYKRNLSPTVQQNVLLPKERSPEALNNQILFHFGNKV